MPIARSTKMKPRLDSAQSARAAELRLSRLARLDDDELRAVRQAASFPQRLPAHRELVAEGAPAGEPHILLEGWMGRIRHFSDGRRQILSFILPGDRLGVGQQNQPRAAATVTALTPVLLCRAPQPRSGRVGAGLAEAYAMSAALEEQYMLRQIARIGRLSAHERLIDWMLEMYDRLELAGLAEADAFPMPLTQEALADALGLTSVHVNRTLQSMRRERLIEFRSGVIQLSDPRQLANMVDYRPPTMAGLSAR